MDLGYYGYLAQTIPPREIVRALAVRARRALLRGKPFFFEVPHRRRALAPAQRRPALLAHGLSPAKAADEILREAQAALGGELRLFGQLKRCGVPIDYHRDPSCPPSDTTHRFRENASTPSSVARTPR